MDNLRKNIKELFSKLTENHKSFLKKINFPQKEIDKIKPIDQCACLLSSMDSFIYTANYFLQMWKDFNPKCLSIDESFFGFDEIIYFQKDGKDYAFTISIPGVFCDQEDIEKLEKWRKNNGKN